MSDFTDVASNVLPQLSIGVVAVLAFAVSIYFFIRHLERCNTAAREERQDFQNRLDKRDETIHKFEQEVRTNIVGQLTENTHLMTRIIDFLDQPLMRAEREREARRTRH